MTEKKLRWLIHITALVLYFACLCTLFSSAYSNVATQFEYSENIKFNQFESELSYNEQNMTVDKAAVILSNNMGDSETYDAQYDYPYSFGIYDENGKLVMQNAYYYITIGDKYISLDEYITDNIKKEIKENLYNATGMELKSVKYREENGKEIITTLNFFNIAVNEPYTLKLGKENGKEKEIYNSEAVYSNLVENKESVKMSYSFARAFQDKFNTKMQKKVQEEIASGKYFSSHNGGDNTQFITQKAFYIDGKAYSILLDVRYDLFFNTIGSNVFLKNFQVQSTIFIAVEIIISIIAQRLLKKQNELNDARDAFTSAAAHELKTPITIINNQCECIIKNVSPEKNGEYVSTIYNQNRHMSALTNKLLQFNRIRKETLNKSEFDIKTLALEEAEKYSSLAEEKGIKIESDLPENIKIKADRDLIALVIDNFLSNAVKNADENGAIRVTFYKKRFAVYNDGKRISDEDKGKIWEVFSKNADNDIIQSHGMGLAICKKILELHSFKYGFINKLAGVEFYFEVK